MSISLWLLSLALLGPADLRSVADSTKPQKPVVRPQSPPTPTLKPAPKPAPKPMGEPVLKRRRPPK